MAVCRAQDRMRGPAHRRSCPADPGTSVSTETPVEMLKRALSPRRQRMRNEGAVDGKEPQSLDLTLREQHPIERIASRRLGFDGRQRVAFVDRDNPDAQAV